jgi:uncharacterized phage protein gp47/JayE
MINFVRTRTNLTDFQIGSVIRSIIESAALEDDEQYYQMVQLLDAFRLSTATGSDLDERVAEYDLVRFLPTSASGEVVIRDGTLITTALEFDEVAGTTLLGVEDSSDFPTAGFPYTIRIGEGTVAAEDVLVSANNTVTNVLTAAALTNNHSAGARVSFVSGAADISLTPGIRVERPATAVVPTAIRYTTVEAGILVNGNYESTPIRVSAELPGSQSNVGASQLTRFSTSPPFSGALVINLLATNGGTDLETDEALRARAYAVLQSLSNATPLALQQAALGVTDPVTGQQVATANILEDFLNDEVIVYIDDGTGFIPDQIVLARDSVATAIAAPIATVDVVDAEDYPAEGWVLVSPESGAQIELLEYTSVNYITNTLSLVGGATPLTANAHDIGDEVVLVDLFTDNAESGQNFFFTSELPIVRNSYRLWVDTGAGPVLQIEDIDYILNKGTGQIQFTGAGVAAGSVVFATYTYYTGLVAEVQRVLNGVSGAESTFPGVVAAGIEALVETPVTRRITVRLSITVESGFDEANVIPEVREAVEQYITGLGIGDDVIVAEIVERAMGVAGMFNVVVTLPASDVIILENELSTPFDALGNSLVTVT